MSDVPSSLQSWVSTIKTVVLTADAFQLFIKSVWCTTQLAQLSFKLSIGRTHSWRYKTFLACKVWTIQSVVFAADVFQLKKLKNVSCEYDRLNGWNSTLQAAWNVRHVRWTCLFYISSIMWFLWTKPTIWLLIPSFAKSRSRVFYVLSLWRI